MGTDSHVTRAFRNAPLPSGPAYTSIASAQDEVVFPQPAASSSPGVRTVLIQDVCPTHIADHGTLLIDSAAFGLVLDALSHPGPAEPSRIDASVCAQPTMPDVDPASMAQFSATLAALSNGLLNPANWVSAEPPLPPYAQPYGG